MLAVAALGVFVFGGAPVLAQNGTAQPERRWLDRAKEIEQFMRNADVLDKLLELALVAPAVEKHLGGEFGAAVMWVESAKSIKEMGGFPKKVPRSQAERWNQQLIQAQMFHNLVGNIDPNQGNWLVDPGWNLVLIDHSRAFTTGTRLVHKMTRIDPGLWEQFESLDEAILTESLSEWVGGAEIRAILKRRDKMAKEIAKLVAEKGEATVFVNSH